MNGNIRVGNLFGIPFYVNPSWFVVLSIITLTYGEQLQQFPELAGPTPWLLGLVTALLLFASVLAHELGHSVVAISQGIEVKSITLFLFGGVANLDRESKTPVEAFLVAIAGPLVSLLLFILLSFLGSNLGLGGATGAIVALLASINLVLAVFNLIPGLPLDGGNVLKALIWQLTGDANRGLLIASRAGQVLGWLGITIGILAMVGISPIGSFWTALIGWFLLQNAGVSAKVAQIQSSLEGLTAADAVLPNSPIVPIDLNLREFANDYVIGQSQWQKFLVVNSAGELAGVITVDDLKKVPTSDWVEVQVKELVQPATNVVTVNADLPLIEVIKLLEQQQLKQLAVVKEQIVLGLLEKTAIINLLQQQTA